MGRRWYPSGSTPVRPKTGLDFVGYGVQFKLKISGPPANRWAGPRNRIFTTGELVSGNFRTSGDQHAHLTRGIGQPAGPFPYL